MMRPAIELQEQGEAYYFIANYHSMTSLFDAEQRRKNTLDVALDFLVPGRRYRAEIYRDGDAADYRTNPRDIVIEKRTVTAQDRLAFRIAPGGGAAVRFVALK